MILLNSSSSSSSNTPVEKDDSSVGLEIHESRAFYIQGKNPSLRVNNPPLLIVLHFSPLLLFHFIHSITYRVNELVSSFPPLLLVLWSCVGRHRCADFFDEVRHLILELGDFLRLLWLLPLLLLRRLQRR